MGDLCAEFGNHFTVYFHKPLLYEFIGLPTGADSGICHELVQADLFIRIKHRHFIFHTLGTRDKALALTHVVFLETSTLAGTVETALIAIITTLPRTIIVIRALLAVTTLLTLVVVAAGTVVVGALLAVTALLALVVVAAGTVVVRALLAVTTLLALVVVAAGTVVVGALLAVTALLALVVIAWLVTALLTVIVIWALAIIVTRLITALLGLLCSCTFYTFG